MSHVPECTEVREAFKPLWRITRSFVPDVKLDGAFIMMGWTGRAFPPPGLSMVHIVLWKFVTIAMTRLELEGEKWVTKAVWRQTVWRAQVRMRAFVEGVRLQVFRQESRDKPVHTQAVSRWDKQVAPLGNFGEDGEFEWHKKVRATFDDQ